VPSSLAIASDFVLAYWIFCVHPLEISQPYPLPSPSTPTPPPPPLPLPTRTVTEQEGGNSTHHLPSKKLPPPLRPHRRARIPHATERNESLLAHLRRAQRYYGEDGAVGAEEGVEREAEVGFAERGGEVG